MAFSRSSRVRTLWIAVAMGLCTMAVGGAWLAYTMLSDLPDLESVADYRPPLTSVVLDRDGHRIGEFSVERRSLASMEEIPELTRQAFVSAEDANFFEHGGVDLHGRVRLAHCCANPVPGCRPLPRRGRH